MYRGQDSKAIKNQRRINMQSTNGSTTSGSPIHSDFPGTIIPTPQANGGVKPIVTSHMTGNSKNGIEGGIDNKGSGHRGSPFKK